MSGPLSVTLRTMLERLGIAKGQDQFVNNLIQSIQPVINVERYVALESFIEFQTGFGTVIGLNPFYANASGAIQYIYGVGITSSVMGAGVSMEIRPYIRDPASSNFMTPIGSSDFASGASESILAGGQFFDQPIPLLPGWQVGGYVSTLVGVPPNPVGFLLFGQA